MWSSKISRKSKILILRYSKTKGIIFFVWYCFCNPSTAYISGTKCPILMRFSAICSFANSVCNLAEKVKMDFPYFRLILLDHTTIGCVGIGDSQKYPIPFSQTSVTVNLHPVNAPGTKWINFLSLSDTNWQEVFMFQQQKISITQCLKL